MNTLLVETMNDCDVKAIPMQTILGLQFFNGTLEHLLSILKPGLLIVAPSAPSLLEMESNSAYAKSLKATDLAIADSGLMALCWNLLHPSQPIRRISGYLLLKQLIYSNQLKNMGKSFWVMASQKEADLALNWLNKKQNFGLTFKDIYLAPTYPYGVDIEDAVLLNQLESSKPSVIIMNIGGGTQERLGSYLKKKLSYQPLILCTGAALSFMTGGQSNIPDWVDAFYLGWIFRCVGNPKVFIPRYLKALLFIPFFLKYQEKSPYYLSNYGN